MDKKEEIIETTLQSSELPEIVESVKLPPINKIYKKKKQPHIPNKELITIKRISMQNIPRTEKKLIDYYDKIIDWNNNNPSYRVKPPRLFIDDFNYYSGLIESSYNEIRSGETSLNNPLPISSGIESEKMEIVREDPMEK
jgi:hypothetical protein